MLNHFFKTVPKTVSQTSYVVGPTYDGIGAGRYIFADYALLPERYYGAGIIPAQQLRVLQHPQVYVVKSVPVSGLGGLQAGQMVLSPLNRNPVG